MHGNAWLIDCVPRNMQNWLHVWKNYQRFVHGITWHPAFPALFPELFLPTVIAPWHLWQVSIQIQNPGLVRAGAYVYWPVSSEDSEVTMGIWNWWILKRRRGYDAPCLRQDILLWPVSSQLHHVEYFCIERLSQFNHTERESAAAGLKPPVVIPDQEMCSSLSKWFGIVDSEWSASSKLHHLCQVFSCIVEGFLEAMPSTTSVCGLVSIPGYCPATHCPWHCQSSAHCMIPWTERGYTVLGTHIENQRTTLHTWEVWHIDGRMRHNSEVLQQHIANESDTPPRHV